MEFIFETENNQKAMEAMAKALRKTIRKKHSKLSHIFGWIVIIITFLLALPTGDKTFVLNFKTILTYIVILVLLLTLIFEDKLNGYVARKRMLKGTEKSITTFSENGYCTKTDIGNTEWQYDKIGIIVETKDYIVFVFSPSHAQTYDKNHLNGGTIDDFRKFIKDKTGKEIISI